MTIQLQFNLKKGREIYNKLNDSFYLDRSFDVKIPSSGRSDIFLVSQDTKEKVHFLSYGMSNLQINDVVIYNFNDRTKGRVAAFLMKAEVLDDLKKLGLKI